jgi:hypothetical protein
VSFTAEKSEAAENSRAQTGSRILSAFPAGLLLLALLAPDAPLHAQTRAIAAGRVLRVTAKDTTPVPGARVVLHRVGRVVQGPVDSTIAGKRGEFRFRFLAETTAVYLLSSGWQGIEYFSSPLHTDPVAPDTGLVLTVSDTSSASPVRIVSRHLVVSRPGLDGQRPALEIVVLVNGGTTTRVSADSTHPAWATGLPNGAVGFQAGSGDFSGDALEVRNDSVMLFAPVAPGEKQVIYTYSLAAGSGPTRIAVPDSIGVFNILLEEFDRTVKGGGIIRADSQVIEGRHFLQWAGPVAGASVVTIDFPGAGLRGWLLPILVGAVALVLGLVALKTLGRRPATAGAGFGSPLDQLARLDARYAGREGQVPAEEWTRYQAERARLKAEVSSQLARSRPTS